MDVKLICQTIGVALSLVLVGTKSISKSLLNFTTNLVFCLLLKKYAK
jgi:hypothetical protein